MHTLVWLTELGLSVAIPMAVFVFLGAFLRKQFELGSWVVVVSALLGLYGSVGGLIRSLKLMNREAKEKEPEKTQFNTHE